MSAENRSAIYSGEVMHHRFSPRKHRFVYRMSSFLFDLDALSETEQHCKLFSINKFNFFSFYHRDVGDKSGEAPRQYLERTLRENGVNDRLHSATLLCYPRILGFTFNPLSVYYCYKENQQLFAILYEVSNTFKQRHSYLIPVSDSDQHKGIIRQQCDKQFYVSPFIPMTARYHFRMHLPGKNIALAIRETEQGKALLHAVFRGKRRPFSDRELVKNLLSLPLMTIKAVLGIHWEALRLFIKGVKIVPRSPEPKSSISRIDQ
ncbi:Uncharacterised protein [Zhongshania aliphaticivorans]|uniref:DUF1365 domain-containing protein n=1 Tax=Zhongshania aliphaticivorans TaxID=1470434 RepID=A0A5S9Q8Y2_9GAMM|nr:DUF1365 domain-containing protein [Zhongshania aliphaticivorans]CAA0103397.1 Uncharacterised protein [Zhongshania aliphaticivorans]CAA0113536.1 Uncharacterised protein [Zhongshania aliphaticivorans]